MPSGPTGRKSGVKESDTWCTEKKLCDDLGSFYLDPCSNPRSNVHAAYNWCLENGHDGLLNDWYPSGLVFCNPPYSNVMPWALKLQAHPGEWVALLKLDPTTRWWRVLMRTHGVRWAPFRTRVRFERPDKPPLTANFPSALIWRDWTPPAAMTDWIWRPQQR